jgi:hypothetical protein
VRLGGKVWLHSGGEGLRLVEAAANESWRIDVKLAKVVQGMDVFRIELYGALEGYAHFDSEAKRAQGVGMRRLKSVRATEPHLIVTAGGVSGCCELAFVDGIVGHFLSIVEAAEKLVSLAIARVCGDYLAKADGRFIDATLLEKCIGLGYVGQEEATAKEEEKRKDKSCTGRRSRGEHD